MANPEFKTTSTGEEIVVLRRKDYDALVESLAEAEEELADIATLDRRLAEIEFGPTLTMAPEVSAYLMQGANRLEAIRRWRGLSPKELAKLAIVDEGAIIDIESRIRPASPMEAEQLAKALDVSVSWLEP